MAVVPIILVLVTGAVVAAAQLMIQTDLLLPRLVMLVPLAGAILITRLRSASSRLTPVRAGPVSPDTCAGVYEGKSMKANP